MSLCQVRTTTLFGKRFVRSNMESPNVERINPTFRFNLIVADPDDNKFVDCAIIAGATYIVSNDRHFNELKKYNFPKVEVRNLAEFLDIVKAM